MERLMTTGPPVDGRYSLDESLHQMTDDGGPPDGRDNLGEWDTFGDAVRSDATALQLAGSVTVRRPAVLDPGAVLTGRGPVDPGDLPGEPLRGPLWASTRCEGGVAAAYFV